MTKENIILKVRKILRNELEESNDGTIYSNCLVDIYDEYEEEMRTNLDTKHIFEGFGYGSELSGYEKTSLVIAYCVQEIILKGDIENMDLLLNMQDYELN